MAPFSPGRARQALLSKRQGRQAVVGDEIVAQTLALSGITHICGVPGQPIDATLMSAAHSNVSGAPGSAVRFTRGLQHGLFMEAFGERGIRVQRPGGPGTTLRRALASDSTTCNDVLTNEDVPLAAVI